MDGDELINYVSIFAPFQIIENSRWNDVILTWQCKSARHIIVHKLYSKFHTNNQRPKQNEMIFEVTSLGNNGMPLLGFKRCLIDGKAMISYIHQKKTDTCLVP